MRLVGAIAQHRVDQIDDPSSCYVIVRTRLRSPVSSPPAAGCGRTRQAQQAHSSLRDGADGGNAPGTGLRVVRRVPEVRGPLSGGVGSGSARDDRERWVACPRCTANHHLTRRARRSEAPAGALHQCEGELCRDTFEARDTAGNPLRALDPLDPLWSLGPLRALFALRSYTAPRPVARTTVRADGRLIIGIEHPGRIVAGQRVDRVRPAHQGSGSMAEKTAAGDRHGPPRRR